MARLKASVINENGIRYYPRKDTSPAKAIRLFCLECMGMTRTKKDPVRPFEDVAECTDEMCPLYEFRFGKSPYYKTSKPKLKDNSKTSG